MGQALRMAVVSICAGTLVANASGQPSAAKPDSKPNDVPVNSVLTDAALPAYQRRGRETRAHYERYAARLAKNFEQLRQTVKSEAADLYSKLAPKAPQPVAIGYGLLPKWVSDEKPPAHLQKPASVSYSWARTDQFIDWEMTKLDELEEKISVLPKMTPGDRRKIIEKMIADFKDLESSQRTIDHHLQYNQFWQQAIFEDRERFDKLTVLHDQVIERQKILQMTNPPSELIEKAAQLENKIFLHRSEFKAPSFLRVQHPKPNIWVVEVKVYTDIEDERFLEKAKKTIERAWYVEDKQNVFRMKIDLKKISIKSIYKNGDAPRKGQAIKPIEHASHFPSDGGVLTTGANSTFAIPKRFVALGPQDLAPNVLAHEFGHILGFIDGYLRGYRDLRGEGFEVLEIVPDAQDIMCTPAFGRVQKRHFEALIGNAKAQIRTEH